MDLSLKQMLDLKFIRDNLEQVKANCERRGCKVSVDEVVTLDDQRLSLLQKIEDLRAERNRIAKSGEANRELGGEIKLKLKELEPQLKEVEAEFEKVLKSIPNLSADDVPVGKDDSENVAIRQVGEPTIFGFEPKDHIALGENLGLIDVVRAGKVSGPRFGYFKNEAVLLEFALVDYTFKKLLPKNFIPVVPPVMVKKEMEEGMGYSEFGGWENVYVFEKDGLVFVSSSEHSVIPMHAGEVFKESELPRRYLNFSTCFRRESGAYGKDTRGIFRVHQFDKLEMNAYSLPEKSDEEFKFLLSCQEELVSGLGLPYRVMTACTGDLPQPNRRMYDIEAWFPGQGRYREITSCSNCTDYQTRRLNIKFNRGGKKEYVHALNATALAIGRTIIAILENYQQADGSVVVPKVLQEYVGVKIIKPKG